MPTELEWDLLVGDEVALSGTETPLVLRAIDRLLQQYKDATTPGVREVVRALAFEVDDQATAVGTISSDVYIPGAEGLNLDRLGKLIGEERLGKTDPEYLIWILAKVRANRSNGSIEDVIAVLEAVLSGITSIQIVEYYPAAFVAKILVVPAEVEQIALLLKISRKAGVGATLEYSDGALAFSYDGADGLGFGDSTNPATGGDFAGAVGA